MSIEESKRSEKSRRVRRFAGLRAEIPVWQAFVLGVLCIVVCGALWWWLTAGDDEHPPLIGPGSLPRPASTFAAFPSLWFERALAVNTVVSLRRVVLGFALAAAVGVPLGVLCGCFRRVSAFCAPLIVIGRNIPVAAVIPLTFALFGIGEFQKVMFIFIACVAFVVMDSANAVSEVSSRYIDTAYTLGANRWQIIMKVLLPLAMPAIFHSLRLLFGLAFGYIMLAETIKLAGESGGLGDIINVSQRRRAWEDILLVLMVIPLVALVIDRVLYWIQRQLFPYQYGGDGMLHEVVRCVLRRWEDAKSLVFRPVAWQPSPAVGTPAVSQVEPGAKAKQEGEL
jgi:ABC-type nitrate/sulfonate/bicarbonate transport system permease component